MKWCWTDVVFPVSSQCLLAPSQRSRPTASNNGDFPYLWSTELPVWFPEGPIVKGPEMAPGYLFMVSQPNLSAQEQSWLHDSQWCVASQVCLCGRKIGLLWKTSPLGPVDAILFHGHSHRGQLLNMDTYKYFRPKLIRGRPGKWGRLPNQQQPDKWKKRHAKS